MKPACFAKLTEAECESTPFNWRAEGSYGFDWEDAYGANCQDYAQYYCEEDGDEVGTDEVTAREACCACEDGTASVRPTGRPTSSPTFFGTEICACGGCDGCLTYVNGVEKAWVYWTVDKNTWCVSEWSCDDYRLLFLAHAQQARL